MSTVIRQWSLLPHELRYVNGKPLSYIKQIYDTYAFRTLCLKLEFHVTTHVYML